MCHERLQAIKRSFRLYMNGEASRAMRNSGLNYRLNWGVALPDLRRMAQQEGKDQQLAIKLWQEDIRECQILATLIMPAEQMTPELIESWMERADNPEIAQQLTFNLLQHLTFASDLAMTWICREEDTYRTVGFLLQTRLLSRGQAIEESKLPVLHQCMQSAIHGNNPNVARAAQNCLIRIKDSN